MGVFMLATVSYAEKRGYFESAQQWVAKVNGDQHILRSHAKANCEFSGSWIQGIASEDQAIRKRVCNDLVLIWTHKECIYFRDYVTHEAYDPCKSWSRQMYTQRMAKKATWFLHE